MSSPDESTPKTDAKPLPDAARRPAERAAGRAAGRPGKAGEAGRSPAGHRTAGQAALEQALSQSGKHLEDLTGEAPDRHRAGPRPGTGRARG
ncbi:hypothetical protein [Nonomuraea sp. NPDC001831]|uniref:hypothetical protein n=1 Tax=Nonomuraea sp. NPDC001831 TaxID=3364340 RepID=UPI00367705FA